MLVCQVEGSGPGGTTRFVARARHLSHKSRRRPRGVPMSAPSRANAVPLRGSLAARAARGRAPSGDRPTGKAEASRERRRQPRFRALLACRCERLRIGPTRPRASRARAHSDATAGRIRRPRRGVARRCYATIVSIPGGDRRGADRPICAGRGSVSENHIERWRRDGLLSPFPPLWATPRAVVLC
jgi:hypothetical protein